MSLQCRSSPGLQSAKNASNDESLVAAVPAVDVSSLADAPPTVEASAGMPAAAAAAASDDAPLGVPAASAVASSSPASTSTPSAGVEAAAATMAAAAAFCLSFLDMGLGGILEAGVTERQFGAGIFRFRERHQPEGAGNPVRVRVRIRRITGGCTRRHRTFHCSRQTERLGRCCLSGPGHRRHERSGSLSLNSLPLN